MLYTLNQHSKSVLYVISLCHSTRVFAVTQAEIVISSISCNGLVCTFITRTTSYKLSKLNSPVLTNRQQWLLLVVNTTPLPVHASTGRGVVLTTSNSHCCLFVKTGQCTCSSPIWTHDLSAYYLSMSICYMKSVAKQCLATLTMLPNVSKDQLRIHYSYF